MASVAPFYLTVVDNDSNTFRIEGPMVDDRPWNDAVVEAQEQGRRVTCSSSPADERRQSDIISYQQKLGHRMCEPHEVIVRPSYCLD